MMGYPEQCVLTVMKSEKVSKYGCHMSVRNSEKWLKHLSFYPHYETSNAVKGDVFPFRNRRSEDYLMNPDLKPIC